MTHVIVTDIDTNGISAAGLKVLKAVLTHALAHGDVKCHKLPLDVFCTLAGIGELSGEEAYRLLSEGMRVVGWMEVVGTEARTRSALKSFSSPMLNFADVDDSSVAFEVDEKVLHDSVLNKVLALAPPRRR